MRLKGTGRSRVSYAGWVLTCIWGQERVWHPSPFLLLVPSVGVCGVPAASLCEALNGDSAVMWRSLTSAHPGHA